MTVIRPNSISGITSLTAHRGSIDFYAHDGSAATFTNINSNVTSGVSTFASLNITGDLDVGGALTYEDVTNVDSIGVVTARNGIDVTGGNVTMHSTGRIFIGDGGNAVNPMFAPVSDTNTGVAFPAADTILFTTGGTERLRITSAGNIGIGDANPSNKLTVKSGNGDQLRLDNAGERYTQISLRNNGTQKAAIWLDETNDDLSLYAAVGFDIRFLTNGTESAIIDSNGNARLGPGGDSTNSTNYSTLTIANQAGGVVEFMDSANNNIAGDIIGAEGSGMYISSKQDTPIIFRTGATNTEKLRITSDGKIGIGHHTSTQIETELTIRPANDGGILIGRPGDTVAPINRALTITTTTTGSEAYHTKYHTYNCNSIFATYEAGGTGGNFIFKTGTSSGQEVEKLRINSVGNMGIGGAPLPTSTGYDGATLHLRQSAGSGGSSLRMTNGSTGHTTSDGFYMGYWQDGHLYCYNQEAGHILVGTNGTERLRITSSGRLVAGKNVSTAISSIDYCDVDFHCTGPLSVGSNSNNNQAEMQRVGRRVINLYNTTYSGSGGSYLHLETSLWGGGSPHGNSEFIMGGFHIHGYRYSSSGICEEIIYFHQWNGSLANYSRHQYGNWDAGSSCYVGSNGNVYIRVVNSNYYGFAIDFIQHPWYSVRDCTILNATFSNSTSL